MLAMPFRSRATGVLLLIAAVLVGTCIGCGRNGGAAPNAFAATKVFPALGTEAEPLLLNDAITVYFSEPVDPLSVTRDSFAVVDQDGHPVRGRLRSDGTWVTFEPEAPIAPDLQDGSLRPGREYRLVVLGYPRADGIRARNGRLLQDGLRRTFRTASLEDASRALPAPLRPLHAESRPFLLRPSDAGTVPVPIDDPRLQLHFTLPVLPTAVTPAAFAVTLLQRGAPPGQFERIEPRSVRLLPQQAGDEFAGSTVELTFGVEARVAGTDRTVRLQPEDFLGVQLVVGAAGLTDYAGRPVPQQVQWATVVPGVAVTVAEWPAAGDELPYLDPDLAIPGFEVTVLRTLQPLVRVEAGSGSLGAFRPTVETVLAPGQPFDPGDGRSLVVDDPEFDFTSVEVPEGVVVHLRGFGRPVVLRALGRMRIDGRLVVEAAGGGAGWQGGELADLSSIRATASATLVAGSGIEVRGRIESGELEPAGPVALVTAGCIELRGPVPTGTLLATERGGNALAGALDGCLPIRVRLQPGLPEGVTCTARGISPWLALPGDRGARRLRMQPGSTPVHVAWQELPPDPLRPGRPDFDPARASAAREAVDDVAVDVPPGAFLRLRLAVELRGGAALPHVAAVRLLDR